MAEHEMKYAARFLKRHINKAIQRSYLKALTEPITNSHDSYLRLEKNALDRGDMRIVDAPKPIFIYVDRGAKRFQVVDFAEGISHDEMLEKFLEYGEEKGGQDKGYRVRALFGQGLADVMFSQARGIVHSIKANDYCYSKFKWKKKTERGKLTERQIVEIPDRPTHATSEIRHRLHIPSQHNGTLVEFIFAGTAFPQEEKLVERLSNFYMLRLVNSDPKRIVRAIFIDSEGKAAGEYPIRYSFPIGESVGELDTEYDYEEYKIGLSARLYRFSTPLTQAEAGEDREGGLLIFDGQSVFDLSLFGYDENPYARKLFGTLELHGASEVIRAKLNQTEPEEILTESRNGFDKKHPFFVELRKVLDPWLKEIVEKERQQYESETSVLSEETRKRHQRAFDKLNELYKELNDDVIPVGPPHGPTPHPLNGLQFERENVTATAMRKYAVSLYIDTTVIQPSETIMLESDNQEIKVIPPAITVARPAKGDVLSRTVIIVGAKPTIGTVTAKVRDKVARLNVEVVPATEYTPTRALEFHPSEYRSQSGRRNAIHLYADPSQIPVGSRIDLECDNPNVALETGATIFTSSNLQSNGIAHLVFFYRGAGEGQKAVVHANSCGLAAEAVIQIVSKAEKPPHPTGKFAGWDYQELEVPYQSFYDSDTGKVIINANHPLNRKVFGTTKHEAEKRAEKLPHCQTVLAELILEECLTATLFNAYKENKLDRRFEDDAFTDIRLYIAEQKRVIGSEIYSLFVNEGLVNSLIEELGAGLEVTVERVAS